MKSIFAIGLLTAYVQAAARDEHAMDAFPGLGPELSSVEHRSTEGAGWAPAAQGDFSRHDILTPGAGNPTEDGQAKDAILSGWNAWTNGACCGTWLQDWACSCEPGPKRAYNAIKRCTTKTISVPRQVPTMNTHLEARSMPQKRTIMVPVKTTKKAVRTVYVDVTKKVDKIRYDRQRIPTTHLQTVTETINVPVPVKGCGCYTTPCGCFGQAGCGCCKPACACAPDTVQMATQLVSKQVPVVSYEERDVAIPYTVDRVIKVPKHVQVNVPDTILKPHIVIENVQFEVPVYTEGEKTVMEKIQVEDCSDNMEEELLSNEVEICGEGGCVQRPQIDLTHQQVMHAHEGAAELHGHPYPMHNLDHPAQHA